MHPLCAPQRETAMIILQAAGATDLRHLALLTPPRADLLKQGTRTSEQPCKQDANDETYDEREGLKLHGYL